MEQIALPKRAAMMDVPATPKEEGSVKGTKEIRLIQKHEVMKDGPPSHQIRSVCETC